MGDRFDRCKTLFGDDFEKIKGAKVLILGVGGVGGYALDCLYRSGVANIAIVDFDTFDVSNQNRQIGSEAVGALKVLELSKKYPKITPIAQKITPKWVEEFDFEPFDVVIDAIDDMAAKVAIAKKCYLKLISSCGSAKRVDPSKIKIDSIKKTFCDPLAKKFRYELKKAGFEGDFDVVFSSEEAKKLDSLGSFVGVSGSFGLFICARALERILGSNKLK